MRVSEWVNDLTEISLLINPMLLSIYRIMKFEILGDQLIRHAYFTGEEIGG